MAFGIAAEPLPLCPEADIRLKEKVFSLLKCLNSYVRWRTLDNVSRYRGTGPDAYSACADAKPHSCDAARGGLQAAAAAARARGDGPGTFRLRIGRTSAARVFPHRRHRVAAVRHAGRQLGRARRGGARRNDRRLALHGRRDHAEPGRGAERLQGLSLARARAESAL